MNADHYENIAELLSESALARIATDVLAGIEEDERSRAELIGDLARGLDILAVRLEQPRSDSGSSAAPMEGMSNARHPLALEAAIRFRSNFIGEFLPADGPVKIQNTGKENPLTQALAEQLEKAMNTYLKVTATEYYPDTDKMGFGVGWSGCGFKKGFHCPIRRRPVLESVPLKDLIINNSATDLQNAERITQVIRHSRQVLMRMKVAGAYRNVDLMRPQQYSSLLDTKEKRTQGIDANSTRTEDMEYTVYECYCYLNIEGFEHIDDDGEETGLPLPYKVSVDKTSHSILEIRRDWEEDDHECLRKMTFVMYPFEPMFGFYPFGLLKILGNTTNSLTAAWRILLDSGMFGNFPGWLHPKTGDQQLNNTFRCPPGGGVAVELPPGVGSIKDNFVPLPYKTPDPVFVQLVQNIEQAGQRLAGTTELQVGEGRQDAPVGSTLAMIEQATRMMMAVHKRLHIAQSHEFRILRRLFMEDPEALWRHNKDIQPLEAQILVMALQNCELIPAADPNIPSHMHRMLQAQTLKATAMANPGMYDMHKVDVYVLSTAHISQPEQFFAPPPPPQPQGAIPPDPRLAAVSAKLQSDQRNHEFKLVELQATAEQKALDRQQQMEIEKLRMMREIAVHPDAAPLVTGTVTP